MLCPNEAGCTFNRFLAPQTNGKEDLYEMFDGVFVLNDICNFKITNPSLTDLNDVMYLRLEYVARAKAILVKGQSLDNPIAMYTLNIGQDYTALRGINFFLLFISTEESSGDFVFSIRFNKVSGTGVSEPTSVSFENSPLKPEEFGTGKSNISTNNTSTNTSTNTTSGSSTNSGSSTSNGTSSSTNTTTNSTTNTTSNTGSSTNSGSSTSSNTTTN